MRADNLRCVRRHQGAEDVLAFFVGDRRIGLFDAVSQTLEDSHSLVENAAVVSVGRGSSGTTIGKGNTQPAGVSIDLLEERAFWWRREIGIARGGKTGGVEDGGSVTHGKRHGVLGDSAADALT